MSARDPNMPDADAERQPDGAYVKVLEDGSRMRWSKRPDGTWRKPERTRAGFTGELEQKKYVPAPVAKHTPDPDYDRGMPRAPKIPGLAPEMAAQNNGPSKNEKKKEKRQDAKLAKEKEEILANANGRPAPAKQAPVPDSWDGEADGYPAETTAEPVLDIEKRKKNLAKKLKQIEELEDRQKKGEDLGADQLAKIASKSFVKDEIASLEKGVPVAPAPAPAPVAAKAKAAAAAPPKAPEAPAQVVAQAEPEAAADPVKRKKQLTKKLQQIQALEEKQSKGEALDAEQQAKLMSKAAIEAELKTL